MELTCEQQAIIDYIKDNEGLVMVSAIAGSGKTAILSAITNTVKPKNALYLAYNKSVATEAQKKFPKTVHSLTTHALAYRAVVVPNKLKVGFLSYRDLPRSMTYESKISLIDYIKQFCLSEYTDFKEFAKANDIKESLVKKANVILNDMATGKIDCTHDFYLKMYHKLLVDGSLEYDEFDLIMLDEAGDINPVTLEIFKALPARRKVMVGDPYQNIYMFNHTINCFNVMKDEGVTFPMSQSFRVDEVIAEKIEKFCQANLNENMQFRGVKTDKEIKTRAYIARTNASLIGKMIELNELGVQYGLTRTAKQIFDLPLMLCGIKETTLISKPEYKFLQEDIDNYYEDSTIREDYKTVLGYLKACHQDDLALGVAVNLIATYGKQAIISCYEQSLLHEKKNQSYMLGTSHSTKGLEFDEVTLDDDLNTSVAKAIKFATLYRDKGASVTTLPEEYVAELNLYYVACSRAKKVLYNATFLG